MACPHSQSLWRFNNPHWVHADTSLDWTPGIRMENPVETSFCQAKKNKSSAIAPTPRLQTSGLTYALLSLLTHKVSPLIVPKFLHVLLGVHSFSQKTTVEGVHLERTVPFLMKARSRNTSMCFLSRDLQLWLKFQDIIKVCLDSIKIIRPPNSQTNNCVWMLLMNIRKLCVSIFKN